MSEGPDKRHISNAILVLALTFIMTNSDASRTTAGESVALSAVFLKVSEMQTVQQEKSVEQVRKNIQVLKGLPASQLFPLMNFVSASLGVRCDYCHVNAGGDDWVWESDDKQTKRVGRQMMRMVLDINRNNLADFQGTGITCYTCHRGQTVALTLPPLTLNASGNKEAESISKAKIKDSFPTVEQVLNKYFQAVGGKETTAKFTTRVFKGVREASEGRHWPLEIYMKEPDKFLLVVTVPQQGVIYQGFDGVRGWVKNPGVEREMNGIELEALKQTAELYQVIKVKSEPAGAAVTGKEKIGEREAYILQFQPAKGVTEKLYFDVQTGLLLRKLTLTSTLLVPIPEQIDFEDYREIDGVRVPFTITISNIDTWFSSTRRFTEVRHNVPIDDLRFKPPTTKK